MPAIVAEISGEAFYTGEHTFYCEVDDPMPFLQIKWITNCKCLVFCFVVTKFMYYTYKLWWKLTKHLDQFTTYMA